MKKMFIAAGMFMIFMCSFGQSKSSVFNNAMGVSGNNNQSFESEKTSKSNAFERHRLWLNMTNTGGAFKQLLIGYIQGATDGYDSDFDGVSINGHAFIDFYSINLSRNLVIQGRALPFKESDVVPLGFSTNIAGEFTIAIGQADGVLVNQPVYLEDKLTKTIRNLREQGYTFTTKTGVFNDRFVLRYTNTNNTLATEDFEDVKTKISIGVKNEIITINSNVENIDKIFVYDIFGKQLSNQENIGNTQFVIQNLPSAQQILLLKVLLENGQSITKKAILQ
ncbi:T9SS sorting signal type C domain-containing protein [Flavobacterium chungangense]|uniref:Calcium-binding protein n=1 Tax=Flavobacterium chungangense TaxID=554283 RepID=A0A6V6YNT5_9FLAO|nr:T9SS sorting signal type C domain-containing protein [Flavobacterium chungangense]CAD0000412.1 calcium-binding protein [Flavobacterium chungangense]